MSGRLTATEGQAPHRSLLMLDARDSFRDCRVELIGVRTPAQRLPRVLEHDPPSLAVVS